MALSHHGNHTLMRSWPDISVLGDITAQLCITKTGQCLQPIPGTKTAKRDSRTNKMEGGERNKQKDM